MGRMGNKLYVGNLPYKFSKEELSEIFEPYGEVVDARIVMDKHTMRSKGFGFVEMSSDDEATAAVEGLKEASVGGRHIVVNEAKPQKPREPRSERPRSDSMSE